MLSSEKGADYMLNDVLSEKFAHELAELGTGRLLGIVVE